MLIEAGGGHFDSFGLSRHCRRIARRSTLLNFLRHERSIPWFELSGCGGRQSEFCGECSRPSRKSGRANVLRRPPAAAKRVLLQDSIPDSPGTLGSVTTSSAEAQRWFDQGIQLLYGYNHDEAIRSFEKAAEIDPSCAMGWWGSAYARGMHINNPEMGEEQSRLAFEAAEKAVGALDDESAVEQALVRAVRQRYEWPAPEDRHPLEQRYADAMEELWHQFPDDPDVGALFAESLMNLQPWDLWTSDAAPKGRVLEILAVLERTLAKSPAHPGANHFYIHAIEASPWPERGLEVAQRLQTLVPGSGHLVHMPSHIFIRTGRYAEAADANRRAIAADEAYFVRAPEAGFLQPLFHAQCALPGVCRDDGRLLRDGPRCGTED